MGLVSWNSSTRADPALPIGLDDCRLVQQAEKEMSWSDEVDDAQLALSPGVGIERFAQRVKIAARYRSMSCLSRGADDRSRLSVTGCASVLNPASGAPLESLTQSAHTAVPPRTTRRCVAGTRYSQPCSFCRSRAVRARGWRSRSYVRANASSHLRSARESGEQIFRVALAERGHSARAQ